MRTTIVAVTCLTRWDRVSRWFASSFVAPGLISESSTCNKCGTSGWRSAKWSSHGMHMGMWIRSVRFNQYTQEPMSRGMQLSYISVTAFSLIDLVLDRICFKWDSRGSAITKHKALIDVTASLDRNCLFFHKRNGVLKIDQSVKMPWHRLTMGVGSSCSSAPGMPHG